MTQRDVKAITGGPSKMELMLAMFDSSIDQRRPVTFNYYGGNPKFVMSELCYISTVGKEDGSGESFNFTGTMAGLPIQGRYNIRLRTGTFHFV